MESQIYVKELLAQRMIRSYTVHDEKNSFQNPEQLSRKYYSIDEFAMSNKSTRAAKGSFVVKKVLFN